MELNLLDARQLTQLYEEELVHTFPREELKPLRAMLTLLERGCYHPLALTEDGQQLGYALLWTAGEEGHALLEYLGVMRGLRNGGLGARMLALLGERYPHLFGEAEAPTDPDPAVNDLRRRRLAFYERNGFRILGYECALFGVHFNCLYRGSETDDQMVLRHHRKVYADYFSPEHMQRFIQLPLHPGEAIHPAPRWLEEDETEIFPEKDR